MPSEDEAITARLAQINLTFSERVPFNKALGIEVLDVGRAFSIQRLPPDPRWVGDPVSGAMHNGAIVTLLDSVCGAATFMSLDAPAYISTLDLRIDHLRPASAERPLTARADCYRRTRQIAFIRCSAWQDDPDNPVSVGTATFALSTPHGRPGARKMS